MRIVLGSCVLLWVVLWTRSAVQPSEQLGQNVRGALFTFVALAAAVALELRRPLVRSGAGRNPDRIVAAALAMLAVVAAAAAHFGPALVLGILTWLASRPTAETTAETPNRRRIARTAGATLIGAVLLVLLRRGSPGENLGRITSVLEHGLASTRVPAVVLLTSLVLVVALRRRPEER